MPEDPTLDDVEQDTPETPEVETEAPVEDTPVAPAIDFEQRYTSLRPEFDRTKQQLAEERALREQYEEELRAARQGTREQPELDEEYEDDPYLQKLAEIEARQLAAEQKLADRERQDTLKAQQEQEYAYIDDQLESLEKRLGESFDDDEARWIGNYAGANRDEHGRPDVELAYQAFNTILERRKQKWVETKPTGGKPAAGPGAVEVPDLDDPDEVERVLNQAFEAHFGN